MNTNRSSRRITAAALIAAIYAALSLALAPFSFGQVQVRVSEALTMLCVFNPAAIWGVTLGCFITNLIGVLMGANILGFVDVFTGTFATFAAAFLTYKLGSFRTKGFPLLSSIPPVILNGVIVGSELFIFLMPAAANFGVLLGLIGSVALGEVISCTIIGSLLVRTLERTGVSKVLSEL